MSRTPDWPQSFGGMPYTEACRREQDRLNGIRRERPLTEQQIREIIRDEMAKAKP